MPPAYTSAVSKNVTPASNEFLTSASASFWPSPPIDCHMPLLSPNVIVPRQTSDTSKPVRPSFLYRIVLPFPASVPAICGYTLSARDGCRNRPEVDRAKQRVKPGGIRVHRDRHGMRGR